MFSPTFEQNINDKDNSDVKQAYLIQNGHPDQILTYTFKRQFCKEDVIRLCEKNWWESVNSYRKTFRFFMIDGVEYDQEDLIYIKNKARIYVSRGDDFDQKMNFGQYQIIKQLGQGGFGKVVLAKNIITNENAAVKILKVDKICGANDIDMIFREIENLKALSHPNIVEILNCYTLKDMQVYVVMEYLEGGELLSLLREKKFLAEEQAKVYFRQIISAVSYCHRQNIIHRDLKVENILFKDQQRDIIKIADFGISGMADRFNPDIDSGTLKYMAPEILSAKQKSNTPAVDVWACGIILYYMLYGFLPFNGNNNSQIISSICKGKIFFPKRTPQVSDQCKELICRILLTNPKKRIKMCQFQQEAWLQTRQSKMRKQLSLRIDSDYIRETEDTDDALIEQKTDNDQKIYNLADEKPVISPKRKLSQDQLKNKGQKRTSQTHFQSRFKQNRKSIQIPFPPKKKTLRYQSIPIPQKMDKEKLQIFQEIEEHGNVKDNINGGNKFTPLHANQKDRKGYIRNSGVDDHNRKPKGRDNYCSQELPYIKDQNVLQNGIPNCRLGSGDVRKGRPKREELSINKESRESRIKKKTLLIINNNNNSNWK